MTIHIDLRSLIRPRRAGKRRPDALVIREAPSFHTQLEQRAFWWKFSTDRRDLMVKQQTQRLVRTLLQDEERARMDEVHASRASRRELQAVAQIEAAEIASTFDGSMTALSRLDLLDGLGER